MSGPFQPGRRVRLLRSFGFHTHGDEATVIELRPSLLNGYDTAIRHDDGTVSCVNYDEIESVLDFGEASA